MKGLQPQQIPLAVSPGWVWSSRILAPTKQQSTASFSGLAPKCSSCKAVLVSCGLNSSIAFGHSSLAHRSSPSVANCRAASGKQEELIAVGRCITAIGAALQQCGRNLVQTGAETASESLVENLPSSEEECVVDGKIDSKAGYMPVQLVTASGYRYDVMLSNL